MVDQKKPAVDQIKTLLYNVGIWLMILVSLAFAGCSKTTNTGTGENPASQQRYQVARGNITGSLVLVGNLAFSQSSELSWKTDGVISHVRVTQGAAVKKDDILAELSTDSLSSMVIAAEKKMIDAKNQLSDVMVSETNKVKALATLTASQIDFQKTKGSQEALYFPRGDQLSVEMAYDSYQLAKQNFSYAKEDYRVVLDSYKGWDDDERKTYFESYQNTYNTLMKSMNNWKWLRGAPNDTELASAQGKVITARKAFTDALETYSSYAQIPRAEDVQKAQSDISNAEADYNKRYIRAPFDGVISDIDAEEGQFVKNRTVAFTLEERSQAKITIELSELDYQKVSEGQEVQIIADSNPGKVFTGKIAQISKTGVVKSNGTFFTVQITVDKPDSELKSGMTVTVKIPMSAKTNVLVVPVNAIRMKDGKNFVQMIDVNGASHEVEIQVGSRTALAAEVTSGAITESSVLIVPSIAPEFYKETGISEHQGNLQMEPTPELNSDPSPVAETATTP